MARSLGNFQAGPIGFHLHVGVVVQMLYHWCPSAYLFSVENVHSVCVWGYLGFSEPGGISFVDKGVGGGAGRAGGGLPWAQAGPMGPGGTSSGLPSGLGGPKRPQSGFLSPTHPTVSAARPTTNHRPRPEASTHHRQLISQFVNRCIDNGSP